MAQSTDNSFFCFGLVIYRRTTDSNRQGCLALFAGFGVLTVVERRPCAGLEHVHVVMSRLPVFRLRDHCGRLVRLIEKVEDNIAVGVVSLSIFLTSCSA